MKNIYKINWSDEALHNLRQIIEYLQERWSQKEISKFAKLLEAHIELIRQNSLLFPESDYKNDIRHAVLSKQTSIYYCILGDQVQIITIFDNRQNPKTLRKRIK